eukprot:9975474-Alexandrium_andersonii.AAC.1
MGAWGGSTSGVERLFAAGCAITGAARTHMDCQMLNDELQLVCDKGLRNRADDDALIAAAQLVWAR